MVESGSYVRVTWQALSDAFGSVREFINDLATRFFS